MKKSLSIIILSAFSCILAASAMATVPKLINYSGKLTDKAGNVLPDKAYDIRFSLWTAQTGGSEEWWEEHYITQGRGVQTYGGGFNVVLGGTNPLPAFEQNYWLQITVTINSTPETFSRQQLLTVPYSIRTQYANEVIDNSITSSKIQDGTISSADIADGTVQNQDLTDSIITNSKIANNAVSESKITLAAIQGHVAIRKITKNNGDHISDSDLPSGFARNQCFAIASLKSWEAPNEATSEDNWTRHIHCYIDTDWIVRCVVGYNMWNGGGYTEIGGVADIIIFGLK